MGWRTGPGNRRGSVVAQRETACQNFGKPDERQNCRQADDRNHDAAQHDSHPIIKYLYQNSLHDMATSFRLLAAYNEFFPFKLMMNSISSGRSTTLTEAVEASRLRIAGF
jgi:hypothetical protein